MRRLHDRLGMILGNNKAQNIRSTAAGWLQIVIGHLVRISHGEVSVSHPDAVKPLLLALARLEFLIKDGPRATPREFGQGDVRGTSSLSRTTGFGSASTKRDGSVGWQQIGSALAD